MISCELFQLFFNWLLVSDQLAEIRKFTLARLICDNLDHVNAIQPFVLLQPLSVALKQLGLVASNGHFYFYAAIQNSLLCNNFPIRITFFKVKY